jgi:hypothetical protein
MSLSLWIGKMKGMRDGISERKLQQHKDKHCLSEEYFPEGQRGQFIPVHSSWQESMFFSVVSYLLHVVGFTQRKQQIIIECQKHEDYQLAVVVRGRLCRAWQTRC